MTAISFTHLNTAMYTCYVTLHFIIWGALFQTIVEHLHKLDSNSYYMQEFRNHDPNLDWMLQLEEI